MKPTLTCLASVLTLTSTAFAHTIESPENTEIASAFDITFAAASAEDRVLTFALDVRGLAGAQRPEPIGQLTGAPVLSYVWPTNMDPALVGFTPGSGILALAVTAHPDFDDTPLFDENGDGDPANDGADWHSHWVVLTEEPQCGAGLKVRDVSAGTDLLPLTAPGLPIALDSPGMSPLFDGDRVTLSVPVEGAHDVTFDAVTAGLQVNETGEAPLLCVTEVFDVASGDLSLPGRIMD